MELELSATQGAHEANEDTSRDINGHHDPLIGKFAG